MDCPRCGATNRDTASYCDSYGNPLVPGKTRPATGSTLLVELMTADWLLSFTIVGIVGVVAGIVTLSQRLYLWTAFFLGLGIFSWASVAFILKNNPANP